MSDEQWNKTAERVFHPPYDPWGVLDAFFAWFEVQAKSKGYSVRRTWVSLRLSDGRIRPKTRAEALKRVQQDNLIPEDYYEDVVAWHSPNTIATVERLGVEAWWNFERDHFHVRVTGPDRDEVMGFGSRLQAWLDALTPPEAEAKLPAEHAPEQQPEPVKASSRWVTFGKVVAPIAGLAGILTFLLKIAGVF